MKRRNNFQNRSVRSVDKVSLNQRPQKNEMFAGKRVIIGTHSILEAIDFNQKNNLKLILTSDYESHADLNQIYDLAKSKKIEITQQLKGFLDNNAPGHQGAVLLSNVTPEVDWEEIYKKEESVLLILDGIEDPHNLGAIIRTSWLTSVDGIIIPKDRAVGLTLSVHKVACGGVEHVPLELATNFTSIIEDLKEKGYWVYGLSHKSEKTIFDLDLPKKVVWVVGSEDKGMRVATERACDELVRLPQKSASASYNASVATALALMETVRQKTGQKP